MEMKNTTAARRVNLSEMSDLELKEYYKKQKEEKERRKKIKKEIEAEENEEKKRKQREIEIKREREYNNWLIQRKEKGIKEEKRGALVLIGILILVFILGVDFEDVGSIIAGIIYIGTFIVLTIIIARTNIKQSEKLKESYELSRESEK